MIFVILCLQPLNCQPYQVVVQGIDERLAIAYPTMIMLHLHTLTLIRYPYLCHFLFSNPRCLTSVTTELKCLAPVWGLGAPSDVCRKYLARSSFRCLPKVSCQCLLCILSQGWICMVSTVFPFHLINFTNKCSVLVCNALVDKSVPTRPLNVLISCPPPSPSFY
jgi:hypothetical protein